MTSVPVYKRCSLVAFPPLNQILCKQKKYVKTDVAVIPERQKETSLLIEPCGNDGE